MHYLQKQLLEEEKKKAKLNAGHCKTEGKKKTKLNAGHCKTESEELDEQKGQKFNFARARKVFEKHWREMERKVVNELVQPYEGRGPVNYDLKAERQVSDYFETNTEDLLDYITERFEDLNSGMNESLGGFSGVGDEINKLSRKLKYEKDVRRAINKRRPTLDTPYPYAGYPIDPYQFGGMRGPNRSTEDDRP